MLICQKNPIAIKLLLLVVIAQCNIAKRFDGDWSFYCYNQFIVVSGIVISGLDCIYVRKRVAERLLS